MELRVRLFRISVAFLSFATSTGICQSPAEVKLTSLTGIVVDQTGAKIPGAAVSLFRGAPNSFFIAKTRSDGSGQFTMQAEPEEYVLTVEAAGFLQKGMRLTLAQESQSLGEIQLKVGDDRMLGPCCFDREELPLDTANDPEANILIEPFTTPEYKQPPRRFRRHRWAWRAA